MDFIRKYDIELEKEHYYAGEILRGRVVIENVENLRVTCVQLFLRGKAHVEWRITRGGERRTVKEDQYFIDEKLVVWGTDNGGEGLISILPRGDHRFPFEFQLPSSCLPCSFESRIGTVRYYLRVIIDIPYASPPQGLKYFTVIGPHLDCMDERYRTPLSAIKQTTTNCLCCASGPVGLEAWLEQSAYCCGEHVKVKCEVQNGSDQDVSLFCRLVQIVEFRMNKGAFGLTKDVSHQVLDFHSQPVAAHSTKNFHDLYGDLRVPVMPPTMVDVCRIIEINYFLRIGVHFEKSGDDLQIEFPFIVATVPHRLTNGHLPELSYEPADEHVEGGIYISPEFQLGQVYDGAADQVEEVILYRPVYVCIVRHGADMVSNGHSPSSQLVSAAADRPAAAAGEGHDQGSCSSRAAMSAPDGHQQQQQAAHRAQLASVEGTRGQGGSGGRDHAVEDMGGCRGDALQQQAGTTRKDLRQSPKRLSKAGASSSSSSSTENPECRTSGTESSGGGHRRQSRDVLRSSVENNNLQRRTVFETAVTSAAQTMTSAAQTVTSAAQTVTSAAQTVTSAAQTVTSAAETVRTSVISTSVTSSSTLTTATMTSSAVKQIVSAGSTTSSSTTSVEQQQQHRNVLSHQHHHHHHLEHHHHTEAAEGDPKGPLLVKTGSDVHTDASDPALTVDQRLKAAQEETRPGVPLPKDPLVVQSRENPKDGPAKTARDGAATAAAATHPKASSEAAASTASAKAPTGSRAAEARPSSGTASIAAAKEDGTSEDAMGRVGAKTSAKRPTTVAIDSRNSIEEEQRREKKAGDVSSSTTTESTIAQHKLSATTTTEKVRKTFQTETTTEKSSGKSSIPETTASHHIQSTLRTSSEERTSRETAVSQTRESNTETKRQTSSQKPDIGSTKTPEFKESDRTKMSGTGSNVPQQSIRPKNQQKPPPLHGDPAKKIHSEFGQTTTSPETNISQSTAKQTASTLGHREYPV